MNATKILIKFSRKIILFLSLFTWILLWYRYSWNEVKNKVPYYKIALKSSLDQLRSMHCIYDNQSRDYYTIVRFCDKVIPSGEKLKLVIPTMPANRHEFLSAKGRYYLYPRNYGNNAEMTDYILIYGMEDFRIPDGYQKCVVFGSDKYLIAKYGCALRKAD